MFRFVCLASLVVLASGCGLGATSSCDFRTMSVNGPEPRCQERVNTVSAEAFKGACKVAGGVSADGACPKAGVVAGCEIGTQGDGSKVNDWYYAPKTVADVMKECGSNKFLPAP